ncbi:MAG: 2Fe-2S iron-sulfur cluster binding domain-containing protein, partial [Candidatus Sumerlaeia bacterium]|nr:2Fe-2S iron-sulfur cluster binding domain-containing protein [Candidatus Sumerlaeia bacterium]
PEPLKMTVKITINDQCISINPGESVLDALERSGIAILYSCRSGICQSCLVKAQEGAIPPRAQAGLKESLKAQGYFLSCVCEPLEDMCIALPGAGLNHESTILESVDVGAAVRRIRLSIPDGFTWFPGQYITIVHNQTVARSYSLASSPEDGWMELHVRRIPGGILSNWLHDEAPPGTPISLRGPFGDCFYTGEDKEAPLLLAGTGTGLAPLYGILREAIRQDHRGAINLFHGAVQPDGLYHQEELHELACRDNVRYTPCVLRSEEVDPSLFRVGSLDDVVLGGLKEEAKTRAYLCGDPDLVNKLRRKLFLKGVSNRRIFADPFLPTTGSRV